MTGGPVRRVRTAHVEWVEERITDRDLAIADTVNRLRLATSAQLERLHFADLSGRSRAVVRQRVLKRLIDWRVLIPLPRRVGGFGHGSNGLVLALDSAGQWLVARQAAQRSEPIHVRRPGVPSEQFTRHTVAVSELYCRLVEAARGRTFVLGDFRAEPAAWVHDPHGGWLKPDAYVLLQSAEYDDHWWIEADRATESLPTLRRKLLAYADFERHGGTGPSGTLPRVLITTPDERRATAVRRLASQISHTDPSYFHVVVHENGADYLRHILAQ